MKNRQVLALASILTFAIGALAACSDNSTGTSSGSTGSSSGKMSTSSSGDMASGSTSGSSGSTSGSSTSSGASDDGGTTPDAPKMCSGKSSPTDGPFCVFAFPTGSMGSKSCPLGETCCVGQKAAGGTGFDKTECKPKASDCAAPSDTVANPEPLAFECQEPSDCTGSAKACCFVPDTAGKFKDVAVKEPKMACGSISTGAGTRCKASCDAAKDLKVCQSDADCDGKTCILAQKVGGFAVIGACMR
jgi:hypothetical protein